MKLGYIYGSKVIGNMNLGVDPYTGLDSSLTVPGDLIVEGDFTFGNAVVDTMILNGRIATGSIAGATLDIDATYEYDAFSEIRVDVSDWSGFAGVFFHGEWSRISTSVAGANILYGKFMYVANGLEGETGVDISYLQGFLFNVMGKGGSTIGMMRGGEIKCEWAADDTVTDARGLTIEFMGLAAPTNTIFGLYFEKESAAGAMVPFFQEIRMMEGVTIISRTADPNGNTTAPLGSLCLVTSGAGAADRLWMNTDSGTTWTSVTTTA